MSQQRSLLSRLKSLEAKLEENLTEVRDLIREVKEENIQIKAPRQKTTGALPDPNRLYDLSHDTDWALVEEFFKTSEDQARYYLHHVTPPGVTTSPFYRLIWVCHTNERDPYHFYIAIPPALMFNRRINTLIESKYTITSARFLKSILNNAIENMVDYRYYNFQGMRYFAINITSSHPSVKAKPVTYWFDIKSLDTLDVTHKKDLQRRRGFDFVETFRL